MQGLTLRSEFSVPDALVQLLVWVVLTVFTLGLALFFLPYYYLKAPINQTFLLDADGRKVARLQVDVRFSDILGHALLWLILSLLTLGLAYLIYWQSVMKRLMNATRTVPVQDMRITS